MDLSSLILAGKVTSQLTIDKFTFGLETPQAMSVTEAQNGIDVAVQFISTITDNETKMMEDYSSPDKKKELSRLLGTMQSGTVTFIIETCNGLAKQQDDFIKGLSKK